MPGSPAGWKDVEHQGQGFSILSLPGGPGKLAVSPQDRDCASRRAGSGGEKDIM